MCYSAMVRADLERTRRQFKAQVDTEAFAMLYRQREASADLKIPVGLTASLLAFADIGSVGQQIAESDARFQTLEQQRTTVALAALDQEIDQLATAQQSKPSKTGLERLAAKRRKRAKLTKPTTPPGGDYQIYPYHFAPIVIEEGGARIIVPARYRILPRSGVEVPAKYNVFNARRDSLQSARSWKPLFGRQHAIFPFQQFYEWVEPHGETVELSFSPEGMDGMWAASLYEVYHSPDLGPIRSFAMVTDEPPPEVSAAGHDRCPVFISETTMERWLLPGGQPLESLDALLDDKTPTFYQHQRAA